MFASVQRSVSHHVARRCGLASLYFRSYRRQNIRDRRIEANSAMTHLKLISGILASASLAARVACNDNKILAVESDAAIRAEELYNDISFDRHELLAFLKQENAKHPEDVGIAWRLTRAAYDVANLKATSDKEKKDLIYFARGVIDKAVDVTKDNAQVFNWAGIILSSVGDYEGSKASIANSYKIKEYWESSLELDPNRSTTYHLLGRWCIAIADLSWVERQAASVLFGTPPKSSYEEALQFLIKCESLAAGSWKKNSLLIAQVYHKLARYADAKEWASKCDAVPIKSEEDQEVHVELQKLIKSIDRAL